MARHEIDPRARRGIQRIALFLTCLLTVSALAAPPGPAPVIGVPDLIEPRHLEASRSALPTAIVGSRLIDSAVPTTTPRLGPRDDSGRRPVTLDAGAGLPTATPNAIELAKLRLAALARASGATHPEHAPVTDRPTTAGMGSGTTEFGPTEPSEFELRRLDAARREAAARRASEGGAR